LSGAASLTPSERRAGSAQGLANREIARALFISIKTVGAPRQRLPQARHSTRAELALAVAPALRRPSRLSPGAGGQGKPVPLWGVTARAVGHRRS
jgi:DNA-binding CsgD family transcriptional regulator